MATFFKPRTLIAQICFMAVMSAINVIFSFLSDFIPLLGVILIIFLPLTSALVETSCDDRYFPIYAVATIGLSIVVSLSSFAFTLFYVVPSIVSGFIFGLVNKKKLPDFISIFISAVSQTILSFAFIPLMNLLTERDFLKDFSTILKISDGTYFNNLFVLVFFIIGLIQTILSYIVVTNEMKRFGIKNNDEKDRSLELNICAIISGLLIIPFIFFLPEISYVFLGFSVYFVVFSGIYEAKKRNMIFFIILGSVLLVNLFLYAFLNSYIPTGLEILLIEITPFTLALFSFTFYFLKKRKCNIQ